MNIFESKEKFDEGLNTVQSTFDQLEIWCREVKSENEILWEVILESCNEALWEKLLRALADYNRVDSAAFIIKKIRELLEHNKYSLAIVGLNLLSDILNNEEPSEFVQMSISPILDRMFSMNLSELDEMDRLLIDITRWMKRAAQSKLRDSVHEYLHENHVKLNQMIADTNSPDHIIIYLQTLLSFDLYYPLRDLMEYLISEEWPFLDAKIQEEQFAHFLWIAFYLSMDDVLIEVSKESGRFIENVQSPESLLYKKYYDVKNNREHDSQTLGNIAALMTQSRIFEDHEKAKLWEEIIRFLQKRTETSVTLELPINSNKVSSIWQIKNKTDHCPHCSKSKLVKESFAVDGFMKHSDQAQKEVVFELLTCNHCHRIFAYDSMKLKLNRALEPYRCKVNLDPINYPHKQAVNKPMKTPPKSVVITPPAPNYFAWPSTEAKESEGQSDREGNFREETDLHRQGYRITGLNRTQRWDVLVRKAIPKMTLKEIVFTIARNVRLRKSQAGGKTKFAYAIAEWEHDLKRLKQEYYKSNFTWPQY
ncbi:hypothetical protein FE783_00015 [Paenibacillus mesophilus]|uniref:hypothetical protein n=1 Tax=Paenibacillus mesophilus TaxID=2582849 RepID=UPI00110F5EB0|nr:hypothetical protein [Paenibacillus mesophilus]TMV52620.1 hypothetical protein FE783_00015 [Paenibacillus mesophilus]